MGIVSQNQCEPVRREYVVHFGSPNPHEEGKPGTRIHHLWPWPNGPAKSHLTTYKTACYTRQLHVEKMRHVRNYRNGWKAISG